MIASANTDFIQATVELFGAVITIVLGIVFRIVTGNCKKSEKMLFTLIFLTALALIVDAGWYIFDGNMTMTGITLNYICNFAMFICNPISLIFTALFLLNLISEHGGKWRKRTFVVPAVLAGTGILMNFVNLFVPFMYTFDDHNVYERLDGWSIYAFLNSLIIAYLIGMVYLHREALSRNLRISIYIFLIAPFIGVGLQAFNLGISFIQLGTAIGCMGLLFTYIGDWIKIGDNTDNKKEEKKNFWLIECAVLIMMLSISAAVFSCIISVKNVSNDNSEQNSIVLAYMVSESTDKVLEEPIIVSRTMAQSQLIIDAVTLDEPNGTEKEQKMLEMMRAIQREYGYQIVFVASEKTHNYYTYDGFSRVMDISEEGNDYWFGKFKDSGKLYEINIDADKDNSMIQTIFVNMKISDSDGNYLGSCGVGTSVDALSDVFRDYENRYDIEITAVTPEGQVQIASDKERILKDYVFAPQIEFVDQTEVYYQRDSDTATMTKHVEGIDWFLIITDNDPDKLNVIRVVLPAIVIYIIGIIMLVAYAVFFVSHSKKMSTALRNTRALSERDGLTGLGNRYSMDRYIERNTDNAEGITVFMIDINGLKEANDNFGHEAGDEIIKGTAECVKQAFGEKENSYRIGGDEFVIICPHDIDTAKKYAAKFKSLTDAWSGNIIKNLTTSVGYASFPDENSITGLIKKADEQMYIEKQRYYELTGKKRRK